MKIPLLLGVITILLISIYARMYTLDDYSLNFDEIYAIRATEANAWDLATGARYDPGNPPLYFLTLKVWRWAAGDSDSAARVLSIVFFVGTFIALYLQCRKRLSTAATICVLILFAGSGAMYYFSRFARAYSMILFIIVCAFPLIVSAIHETKRNWVSIVFASLLLVAGLYSHYSVYVFFIELCIVLLWFNYTSKQRLVRVFFFIGISIFLVSPWIIFFITNQFRHIHSGYRYDFFQLESNWVGFEGWLSTFTNSGFPAIIPKQFSQSVGTVFVLLMDIVIVLHINRHLFDPWKKYILSFFLFSFNILLFTPIHDIFIYQRYSLFVLPFAFMSAGIIIDSVRSHLSKIVIASGLLIFSIVSFPWYRHGPTEDWKGIASAVSAQSEGIILFNPCSYEFAFSYYYKGLASMYCLYKNPTKHNLNTWNGSLSNTVYVVRELFPTNKEEGKIVDKIVDALRLSYEKLAFRFGSLELLVFQKKLY